MTRLARFAPWFSRLVVLGLLVALAIPAWADKEKKSRPKPETTKVQGVRQWAFKRLDRAHRALAEGNLAECTAALDEMKRNDRKLNGHERSLMWQTYGYIQASREQYAKAVDSFERSLEGDGLPVAAKQNVRYNLAQLYCMIERWDDAIRTFLVWFEQTEDVPADAHYLLAMAYVQKGQRAKAMPHARQAIAKATAPKEPWLQLLLSLLLEGERFREAVPVLEQLVARFPKKTYWMQLSTVHSQLDEHREALAAMELAYDQGMLRTHREITRLAQLYLYNAIPYKAAEILDRGLADEMLESDAETWELLANAWLQARERDRARTPLERAARLSSNGRLYVRLAQVQLDQEQWPEARTSLTAALRKGGLDKPGQVQLLLGIASASEERWDEAHTAFTAARDHADTENAAQQWLASIESELELEEAEDTVDDAAPDASGDELDEETES